ncbi:hypothetical protein [Brachyspira alvinipulli]|nr:hypothetical protein [Brachyspira alvinipulli]
MSIKLLSKTYNILLNNEEEYKSLIDEYNDVKKVHESENEIEK